MVISKQEKEDLSMKSVGKYVLAAILALALILPVVLTILLSLDSCG